jgi:hypothetical protein
MKKLEESDLQIGDILIYENQDFDLLKLGGMIKDYYEEENPKKKEHKKMAVAMYLIVYMIPWFDPGDDPINYKNIYHAAIWGNVNINRDRMGAPVENANTIVEAGPNGIVQESLEGTLEGPGVKNIYVYRFKEKKGNFQNVINKHIRSFYDDVSTPYSYETAWLLAVICSMRYSDGALYELLKEHIGIWGADLMVDVIQDLINKYSKDHQKEMVACSTLVAMIYKNAGGPLAIEDVAKNQPLQIPTDIHTVVQKPTNTLKNKNLPKITTDRTVVTPRQLFESASVEAIGYFPYKGKNRA